MTRELLVDLDVVTGGTVLNGHAVLIENGHILAVMARNDTPADVPRRSLQGGFLMPGFIDTQVNGGGGVLFNDAPTVETIRTIGTAHRRFGTTGFLPTLISDDLNVIAQAIAAVDDAISANVPGVLGIHLEGPFLNAARKGVHDATKFRVLDVETIDLLTSLRNGKTLVTLAPETAPHGAIAALTARGAIVSAGHTEATYEEMMSALEEGLIGVTHLFNAMSQMTARAPGVVGAALDLSTLYAGVIVDGHHIADCNLRVAFAAKHQNRLMLVTDAMPSVGGAQKAFSLYGKPVTVVNGRCVTADGTLAGSDLDMASAVRNTSGILKVPLEAAVQMATTTPASFLGLEHSYGHLLAGYPANLVWMDRDLRVKGTWISGVYEAS
jgi:N-acetylglucosamine-6-phosphate deacetylase